MIFLGYVTIFRFARGHAVALWLQVTFKYSFLFRLLFTSWMTFSCISWCKYSWACSPLQQQVKRGLGHIDTSTITTTTKATTTTTTTAKTTPAFILLWRNTSTKKSIQHHTTWCKLGSYLPFNFTSPQQGDLTNISWWLFSLCRKWLRYLVWGGSPSIPWRFSNEAFGTTFGETFGRDLLFVGKDLQKRRFFFVNV